MRARRLNVGLGGSGGSVLVALLDDLHDVLRAIAHHLSQTFDGHGSLSTLLDLQRINGIRG